MNAIEPKTGANGIEIDLRDGGWSEGVKTDVNDITGRAGRYGLIATGVFILWAVAFPLDSAVVTDGSIAARGQNKLLQHRTGGVIREIMARDGDQIKAGQTILKLDPVNDQAELTRLQSRMAALTAIRQRLEAEKTFIATTGADPTGIQLRSSPKESDANLTTGSLRPDPLLIEQQREFEKGRGTLLAELAALTSRGDAASRRLAGIQQRRKFAEGQVALMDQRLAAMRPLVKQGYLPRKAVWDVEEQRLTREAELAGLKAEEGAVAKALDEIAARRQSTELADQRQTSGRLTEVIGEMSQISDQIRAASNAVLMTDIRAPVAGTLVHTKHQTIGGVVTPGEVLAQIVPRGAELVFRARVAPTDINYVRVGQKARAKITALNPRLYDEIDGEVTFVAADSTVDEKTGIRFFEAEIVLKGLPKDAEGTDVVSAGMVGQGYIHGERRTFASYLLSPLSDSLKTSFRER